MKQMNSTVEIERFMNDNTIQKSDPLVIYYINPQ